MEITVKIGNTSLAFDHHAYEYVQKDTFQSVKSIIWNDPSSVRWIREMI